MTETALLLDTLFPVGVAAAARLQPGDAALLYAEEAQHLGKAIAKRVGEFAAGRICARQVLEQLGIHGFPLLVREDRRPQWPDGIVGSITHTQGFYAAVAARREDYQAIGVDAERVGRVGRHLWPKICTAAEVVWLEGLSETEQARAGALIFSGKEAFYKCQYGLTESWVGFQDVALEPLDSGLQSGRFAVRPLAPLKLEQCLPPPWFGYCRFGDDLVISGMAFGA
ncbi:MAG: 4'-phosphopantetheinyl transferase [Nevskiales bacterium]